MGPKSCRKTQTAAGAASLPARRRSIGTFAACRGSICMSMHGLVYGPLGDRCMHICVDMQRLFAEPSPWATPWISRVLPQIERLVARRAPQTVFTRFLPARKSGQGTGTWKRYYERWASMTIQNMGPEMVELLPTLAEYCPPATTIDKHICLGSKPPKSPSDRPERRHAGHHRRRNRRVCSGHGTRRDRFRLSGGCRHRRSAQLF